MEQEGAKKPVGKRPKGWAFMERFVDEEGSVFKRGKFVENEEKPSSGFKDTAGKPQLLQNNFVEVAKKEIKELDEEIVILKEHSEKINEVKQLRKKVEEDEKLQDELLGVVKRKGFKFYPEEMEYLKQFNADIKKKIFYLCYLTDDCPKPQINVAGQSFEDLVVTRKDGWCPVCSKGVEGKSKKKKAKKRPLYVGQNNPTCPDCGATLKYDNADYKEIEMRQNYPGFFIQDGENNRFIGISGDLIFCIAMAAHKKRVKTPQYDTNLQKDLPAIFTPAINYLIMEWVQISTAGHIILSREVNLRGIKEHYEKTVVRNKSGKVIKEGEKRIFFKEEKRIKEERDVFPQFEEVAE